MELVIDVGERNFLVGRVENMHNEYVAKLSAEISRLSELIDEMEGKCRQPASEFLQDIRSTLARCENEKVPQVVESPSRWKKIFLTIKNLNDYLKSIKGSLLSCTEKKWNQFLAKERENVGERGKFSCGYCHEENYQRGDAFVDSDSLVEENSGLKQSCC
ncbi:stromal interaction molecule 1 [Platysternon megacephalum]|uniref:Stromal interaction molecule 1 n=1 Tax=Platysternon megacephalum TaxID=55544 RepID=A0A4D9DTG2_9SAUR|nr:stromal interaction molecule 1 [Platysternon megacephalum]